MDRKTLKKEWNTIINTIKNSKINFDNKIFYEKFIELTENGICKIDNLFSKDDLKDLLTYINSNYEEIKKYKLKIHDGKVRDSYKSLVNPPSYIEKLIKNKDFNKLVNAWYSEIPYYWRAVIEKIYPCNTNHISWHVDTPERQIKFMILLDDCCNKCAPMYYAKKSHLINNDFILNLKYNYLKNRKNPLMGFLEKHNNIVNLSPDNKYINIDNKYQYENFICSGKLGDCIIFDTTGLHSGNKNTTKDKVRKNITLSVMMNNAYL